MRSWADVIWEYGPLTSATMHSRCGNSTSSSGASTRVPGATGRKIDRSTSRSVYSSSCSMTPPGPMGVVPWLWIAGIMVAHSWPSSE